MSESRNYELQLDLANGSGEPTPITVRFEVSGERIQSIRGLSQSGDEE